MLGGQLRQRAAGAGQGPGGQREPRDEGDAVLGRVVEQRLGRAVDQVEQVLHGDDRRDRLRDLQFRHGDLGEADVADLALVGEQLQLADLVGDRDRRVDAVQLQQVDPLKAQVPQAELDLLAQVLGAPDRCPLAGALPGEPRLGRDDQVVGVGVQRRLDQLLGHERSVAVRGVDEVHAKLDGAAQHPHGLGRVLRVAPDARSCQLHRAVTEPVDGEVAAEGKGARRGGGRSGGGHGKALPAK